MKLDFSPEETAFRDEARRFIAEKFPDRLRMHDDGARERMPREDFFAWHRILGEKGWSVPAWPVEYGGTGWTPTQNYIWQAENAAAETTPLLPFGVAMVGPVIYTFGNTEQKARFLPGIRSGETWWCQGYSEPGAGSDLATLKCRAVRDGDYYVVTGQKTWTTLAQFADWGFFLVRTDPAAKPQAGISFLLIDMKSPGVSVRPIQLIDGAYEVNDVFLDEVRVPVENRIGEENQGWTYAKFLLTHERATLAGVPRSKKAVERLKQIARAELGEDGRPLIEDAAFRLKLAELEIDMAALEFTELRVLADEQAGRGPGPASSLLKIKGTEVQQRITELAVEAVAHYGLPAPDAPGANARLWPDYAPEAAATYLNMRKATIYGGSNEIQRNIIAKAVLGL